ncbi:MAG: adenylate/guanylate cyclase domain-containing protein [Lachnospiraceae bacterium]|nr:adenylate/guanylate cyclase domain-containing protein [Lachnospiraceae bacterium]
MNWKKLIKPAVAVAAAALTALLAVTNVFYGLDAAVTDKLYTNLTGTDRNIIIIAVDEETVNAFKEEGKYNDWIRYKCADLLEYLYKDPETAPAMVALDFMFIEDAENKEYDDRLVKAASLGNVVMASHLVYRTKTKFTESGEVYIDKDHVEIVEDSFPALRAVTKSGFSNSFPGKDGFVRYSKNETAGMNSFAYTIYSEYCKSKGITPNVTKTDSSGQYMFFYSGLPGEVEHCSMSNVLSGMYDERRDRFAGKIVMVGAYAPAFQDECMVPVDRDSHMYGVEVHANTIQAIAEGKTALPAKRIVFFGATFLLALAFLFAASKQKLVPVIIESVVLGAAYCFVGRLLAGKGIFITAVYLLLFLILADVYYVIEKYFLEKWRRRRTLEVFKKYVAPQVIDDISKSGDFVLKLGGEKRDVAVLFVDIRGFTPLSESLQPEQVVAILNEYLALTTKSILGRHGTLDKFIGDATMAVFNAPFDLDDYIYEAVCAAWDIKQGSRELGERLYKQFNKTVGFGVGVNCGPAVVGNIGCEFRMDYTAIGDTVNTAARLEANAKAEEILISEYVYEKLKDRIVTEEVGEIPLKGKSTKLMVYRVLDINKPAAEA